MYYSPVRHSTQELPPFRVRLACVKHAASVQSEPGSNSSVQSIFSIAIAIVLRIRSENPIHYSLKVIARFNLLLLWCELRYFIEQHFRAALHPTPTPIGCSIFKELVGNHNLVCRDQRSIQVIPRLTGLKFKNAINSTDLDYTQ